MGESSTCLLRSFSHPSPTSQESPEGDPIRRALTSSISFGRFMSESLAWEKWSSFNQNRYLEEAEKYSKPGSVAEKKAYFEAHYKKIAAKKAAALLEQQSTTVDNVSVVNMTNRDHDNSPIDIVQAQVYEHIKVGEVQEGSTLSTPVVFPVNTNQQKVFPEERTAKSSQTNGVEQAIEHPISVENELEISNQLQVASNNHDTQNERAKQTIEHPVFVENELKISNHQFASNSHDDQEVKAYHKDASVMGDPAYSENKKAVPSENSTYSEKKKAVPSENSTYSEKKKAAPSSENLSKHNQESKIQPTIKPKIPIYQRKGDHHVTGAFIKKTASQSLEKKRSTQKSLHMSINSDSCTYDNRTSSPVSQKIDDSRRLRSVARTSKESSNQQIPTRASTSGISKHLSVIPKLEKGRTRKTLLDNPLSQTISSDRKSNSPLMHISRSKSSCGSKAQFPTVSSSFSLRSEERAAKRKEYFQKLEQKLTTTNAEKEQHQSKHKGKATDGFIAVRQSFCSKAKANADLPSEKASASIVMKKKTVLSCSSKTERKQTSEVHDNNSRPPWRLSSRSDSLRNAIGKNLCPPGYSAKLVQKKTMLENTSPNIQL